MKKPSLLNEERRAVKIELRMIGMEGEGSPVMRGHAAIFNSPSEVMIAGTGDKQIRFREIITPGAFADALKSSDARALFNHDPNKILGRSSAKTLRMQEDGDGLDIEIDPPDTTYARDLQVSMGRGDVREMSFGFTVAEGGDKWARATDGTGIYTRTITKFDRIYDVSPVTYPAYPETECSLRSFGGHEEKVPVPIDYRTEARNRQMEIEIALLPVESRVSMGYAGYNSLGVCKMCSQEGCLCTDCANNACCNMQTADNGGCCTKCLKPGCMCLGCPNTDECKMMQMYSM